MDNIKERTKIYLLLELEVEEPNGFAIYPSWQGLYLINTIQMRTAPNGDRTDWRIKCLASSKDNSDPYYYDEKNEQIKNLIKEKFQL